MKWTGLNELRESYLSFFESKGHLRMASAPLIPHGDNSLLLINSGMAPLKKYFQGLETPPSKRVTTCQKCIRTPDIERVGKTSRHGTYFEMLGNFSFGDYFKHEATAWAWEYFTKVLEIPSDLIWVSVFEEDDETVEIWTKEVGVSADHIVRMGREDNFWEHGTGPCGPCSEIYFDRGERHGCGSPDCAVGCECDRYVEVWNLVFTQFDSDGKGNYTRLAHPNIDTGMGLERLACVSQDVDNLFEVDTIQNIMKHITEITGTTYKTNEKTDVSLRVITDHIRSTAFMVADGVLPSNEGRGYVLRRLLRRAARHGRLLGVTEPFLNKVCKTVADENLSAYPELMEKLDYITKVIRVEEESFAKTIDRGLELISEELDKLTAGGTLVGEIVFKLHDTYGFPVDLTRELCEERGISVDEDGFTALMKNQRETARQARKSSTEAWKDKIGEAIAGIQTEFIGYNAMEGDAKVKAILSQGKAVQSASEGEEVLIVLDKTPFYGESGGQVGDIGVLKSKTVRLNVTDTKKAKAGQILHYATVESGAIFVDDIISAQVDEQTRLAIMRHHTTAHLIQAALRTVLGDHVHQAGSYVDSKRMRFDFSHFEAVTPEQMIEIENICNRVILSNRKVYTEEMTIDKARERGAMALFGEKYGDVVRVVEIEGFSTELCGGTHVSSTGEIGLMKIVSESSVAAGVRRLEVVSGTEVLSLLDCTREILANASNALKLSNASELVTRCHTVMNELKEHERELEALNQQIANSKVYSLLENAEIIGEIGVITATLENTGLDALRTLGDTLKSSSPAVIACIAGVSDDKSNFLCVCGADAIAKGAHAGNIVRKVAEIAGGKGGGRADSAMAGIADKSKIEQALAALPELVREMIS